MAAKDIEKYLSLFPAATKFVIYEGISKEKFKDLKALHRTQSDGRDVHIQGTAWFPDVPYDLTSGTGIFEYLGNDATTCLDSFKIEADKAVATEVGLLTQAWEWFVGLFS